MKTEKEKLNSLTKNSVWRFPKQDTSFDNAFKAVKLFKSFENSNETNIQNYYSSNFEKFGINSNIHRVLSISQMYGLLTKTPYYRKGTFYNNEKPTNVFYQLNSLKAGSIDYNMLKSEQILKIKMRAIIDTKDYCKDWNIYPVLYTFLILKELKEKFDLERISLSSFYTYVMTCENTTKLNETVNLIINNGKPYVYWKQYSSDSRFLNILNDNISLFEITENHISINQDYYEYFNLNFINDKNIDYYNSLMLNDTLYKKFLNEPQNFNIDLIDNFKTNDIKNKNIFSKRSSKKSESDKNKNENQKIIQKLEPDYDDMEYIINVNNVSEPEDNKYLDVETSKIEPKIPEMSLTKRYSKNPLIGKNALLKVNYVCENEILHETFISSCTNETFMEAHHLIPISFQEYYWENFEINIDCLENIVSLCPTCHRAIHYSVNHHKIKLIEHLFNKKKSELEKIGIMINLENLIDHYS